MSVAGESIYYADKALEVSQVAQSMGPGALKDALLKEVKKLRQKAEWARRDAEREAKEDQAADRAEGIYW